MELKKVVPAFIAAVLVICLFSCRGGKESVYAVEEAISYEDYMYDGAFKTSGAVATSSKRVASPTPAPMMAESAYAMDSATGSIQETERKLIKNGSISLEVNSLETADSMVEEWAKTYGGYVFSSGCSTTDAWYTVKIPAANFDSAMNTAGEIGSMKNKSVYTEDVSDTWYDLESRLSTRRIMQERLSEYLKAAVNIDDLIRIESELNSVTSDIEYMEGRMKRLNGSIEYSTVSVYLNLPYRTNEDGGFQWPDLGENFTYFLTDVVDFFVEFFMTFLYICIYCIPVIAAVVFFYWLFFGKVGLLIRIFRKVSRPRAKKTENKPEAK